MQMYPLVGMLTAEEAMYGCAVGQKIYGESVHSPKFFYEPTTALKMKSFKEWTDGHNASLSRSPVI